MMVEQTHAWIMMNLDWDYRHRRQRDMWSQDLPQKQIIVEWGRTLVGQLAPGMEPVMQLLYCVTWGRWRVLVSCAGHGIPAQRLIREPLGSHHCG